VSAFLSILPFTLAWEGLWVDNPKDPGGATMKGITIGAFTAWRHAKGMPTPTLNDLRNISDAELQAFYAVGYYNPINGDALPPPAALMVFDFGVNVGPHQSAMMLQDCLGFSSDKVDGWVGIETLAAVRAYDLGRLIGLLTASQITFYDQEPESEKEEFLNGWTNRTFARQTAANAMIHVSGPLTPTPSVGSSVTPRTPKTSAPTS
jgi:lysozyme family protein